MVYFKAATVHKDFTSKKLNTFDDHKNFKMLFGDKLGKFLALDSIDLQFHNQTTINLQL